MSDQKKLCPYCDSFHDFACITFGRDLEREISAITQAITERFGEQVREEILDAALRIYERHA